MKMGRKPAGAGLDFGSISGDFAFLRILRLDASGEGDWHGKNNGLDLRRQHHRCERRHDNGEMLSVRTV
jgi:hypothetical protein